MKLSKIAVAFSLLAASSTMAIDSNKDSNSNSNSDLICVESPVKECYPKVFEATKEWQTIKKGQEIPGGK